MLKKVLTHISRNKGKSLITFLVLFLLAVLLVFSSIMRFDGEDFKGIITNSLDLKVILKGNLTYGVYEDRDDYEKELEAIDELYEKLSSEDYRYVYMDRLLKANPYISFGQNFDSLEDMSFYHLVWTKDYMAHNKVANDLASTFKNVQAQGRGDVQNSYLNDYLDIITARDYSDEEAALLMYQFIMDFNSKIDGRTFDKIEGVDFSSVGDLHKVRKTELMMPQMYFWPIEGETIVGLDKEMTDNEYIKITKGRTISDEEIKEGARVILVPDGSFKLDQNSSDQKVEVGDTIPLSIHNGLDTYVTYEFEVVGLYEGTGMGSTYPTALVNDDGENYYYPLTSEYQSGVFMSYKCQDELYQDYLSMLESADIDAFYSYNAYGEELYFNPSDYLTRGDLVVGLNSFDEYETLLGEVDHYFKEINENNPSSYADYVLEGDIADYYDIAGAIESNQQIFVIMSYVSLTAVFLIVLAVYLYQVKRRKEETELLLSLGDNKKHIYRTYLLEYLLIGIIAFLLASVAAIFLSNLVKELMVNQNIANLTAANDDIMSYYQNYLGFDSYTLILILFAIYLVFIFISHFVALKLDRR